MVVEDWFSVVECRRGLLLVLRKKRVVTQRGRRADCRSHPVVLRSEVDVVPPGFGGQGGWSSCLEILVGLDFLSLVSHPAACLPECAALEVSADDLSFELLFPPSESLILDT